MNELHLSQKDIYFDQVFDPNNSHYNIGTYVVIKGELNVEFFKDAVRSVEDVFDVFKFKNFLEDNPAVCLKNVSSGIFITEVDLIEREWSEEKIKKWLQDRINLPFDIFRGILFDFTLIRREESEYWFYFGCHHLFSDGYGVPYVLLTYIFDKYHTLRTGEKREFHFPSYLQNAKVSCDYLKSSSYELDKNYWKERFKESQDPIFQIKSKANFSRTDSVQLFFDLNQQKKIRAFCLENQISLQDFLIAILAVYYKKTNNVDFFDFSLPIHNRSSRKERQTLGVFSKLLPCRIEVENPTLNELFRIIKTNQRQDYRHKQFPVSHFNSTIQIDSTNSSKPFDICVNYRYFKLDTTETELDLKGFRNDATFSKTLIEYSWCDFAEKGNENLYLEIIFREDYFSKTEIELLGQRFLFIIDQLFHSTDNHITTIDILPESERKQLLFTFNNNKVNYPKDKTIVDLFEEQVRKIPNNVAVVFEEKELTYRELNEQSNQLAHYLQKNYTIQPDDLIGIKLDRSDWMIISILGVLKSGGAYVPIDPEYPKERIDYLEKDTKCKVCIDENELIKFKETQCKYSKAIAILTKPENLAYVIYTSGTTGRPKGVMIEHQNLINKLFEEKTVLQIHDDIIVYCLTNYVFDVSLLEIVFPLVFGGKVIVPIRETINNIPFVIKEIIRNKVNLLQGTPTYFTQFMSELLEEDAKELNQSLQRIAIGGESLNASLVSKIKKQLPDVRLNNHYGPTEITIDAIVYPDIHSFESNIIGRPLGNSRVYILDEHKKLVPLYVSAEIMISGPSIARGYLDKDVISKEKFLSNPFKEGETLYKTGDIGRWLPDGNIEFIGRVDSQVKIRGYRIELGEIEQALLNNKLIENAVVLVKENQSQEKELVAYITSKVQHNGNEIRLYLKEFLPEYMLPAHYVQLEALPLNANGKIDKRVLPNPEGLGLGSGIEFIEPRNEMEKKLVRVWEDILKRKNIGVKDDFFAMGGHSLKAVRLNNEYDKVLGVKLSLKELFDHTSIESHAQLITSAKKGVFKEIEKIVQQASYSISDAQRRLWVLSQFEESSIAYNMPGSISLNQDVNIESLKRAVNAVIERHESLRTVFKEDETGNIKQWILNTKDLSFDIHYSDFRKEKNKQGKVDRYIAGDSYKVFDLENGPLLRAALLQTEDSEFVFYFNIHHIISDGWSMEVLRKDIFAFYEAYKDGREPSIRPLKIQYKDYSAWKLEQYQNETFKTQRSYWLDVLGGELPCLDLPRAKLRPRIKTSNGRTLGTYLSAELTQKLKAYTQHNGGTLFMGLLASLKSILYRYTDQKDIIVGTPVAGREHSDLNDQIGFYVNTLALRTEFKEDDSFDSLFLRIAQNTLEAYTHQAYPFDRLVEELKIARDTSRSAVFDVMLVLQNAGETIQYQKITDSQIDEIFDLETKTSKFDLLLNVQEVDDLLSFSVEYNTDVYDGEMIILFLKHYKRLLNELLTKPEQKISHQNYLLEEEKQKLLFTFNDTKNNHLKNKTVIDLFEEQVTKTPGNKAIVFEESKLTYQDLDEQSNQLAWYLKENYHIQPNDLVGIKQNRSEWQVISVMAVLKAGGACVPIDPEYPKERIDYIENDTEFKVCLDQNELAKFKQHQKKYPHNKVFSAIGPDDLAYVIYTSGSTGYPKGIAMGHGSMVNLMRFHKEEPLLQNVHLVLQCANTSFDVSFQEIFCVLSMGATLFPVSDDVKKDVFLLSNFIAYNKIDTLFLPTALFKVMMEEEVFIQSIFESVQNIIVAGEQLILGQSTHKFIKQSNAVIHNHYGPAETHVVTTFNIDQNNISLIGNIPPIGKPISNTSIMLLDEYLQLLPIGAVAEIYIGGDGLAKGYLNNPKLTEEKFIAHPFNNNEQLYRTGDLGRWRADGSLEYIGRKDEQVKIRGFRVELGEIESLLKEIDGVEEAAVIAVSNNNSTKNLIGFVTSKQSLDENYLKFILSNRLPQYMLPSVIYQIADMPLTRNGKTDKRVLSELKDFKYREKAAIITPRNEHEEKLLEIWCELLDLDENNVSINDNFFDLGGHSLKITQLASRIYREFNIKMQFSLIFQNPTIEDISNYIRAVVDDNGDKISTEDELII